MFELDHIAVVCADLDRGAAWLSEVLGVPLLAGEQHPRFGTHNRLLGLADGLYLEVIAPDPIAQVDGPRWFDLDNAPQVPRWGNWICRADDLETDIAGPAIAMSRGDLHWQITVPTDGSLPMQGGYPTLINWDDMAAHPAMKLPDSGCRLLKWEVHHPEAQMLTKCCKIRGSMVNFLPADRVRFVASFQTPNGEVTI